jgi:hypothetical protein
LEPHRDLRVDRSFETLKVAFVFPNDVASSRRARDAPAPQGDSWSPRVDRSVRLGEMSATMSIGV